MSVFVVELLSRKIMYYLQKILALSFLMNSPIMIDLYFDILFNEFISFFDCDFGHDISNPRCLSISKINFLKLEILGSNDIFFDKNSNCFLSHLE